MGDSVQSVRRSTLFDRERFDARFGKSADEMLAFVESVGISYRGLDVLDVGSGDGAIDLGIALKSGAQVVGVDIDPTDIETLFNAAASHDVPGLSDVSVKFHGSDAELSRLKDAQFDHVYSRDVFEHVFDPVPLVKSVYRVLKPGGTFFVQVWPLWHSEWGAHLFDGFERWSHLVESRDEILSKFSHPLHKISFDSCARTSIEEMQRAFLAGRFETVLVELISTPFTPTPRSQHLSWTTMGVSGFKALLRKPF